MSGETPLKSANPLSVYKSYQGDIQMNKKERLVIIVVVILALAICGIYGPPLLEINLINIGNFKWSPLNWIPILFLLTNNNRNGDEI